MAWSTDEPLSRPADKVVPEEDLAEFTSLVHNPGEFIVEAADKLDLLGFCATGLTSKANGQLLKTFLNRILGIEVDVQNQVMF